MSILLPTSGLTRAGAAGLPAPPLLYRLGGEKTLQPYCEVAQITQEDCKG